jgi:D-alanyl-D-alanine carboxypeptidase/D-alanyl-D-alanine-endopeptidase (penicillin-binding protein 4)
MKSIRSLVIALSLLVALPAAEARPQQAPRKAQVRKPPTTRKVVRRPRPIARPKAKPAAQARPSELIQRRPLSGTPLRETLRAANSAAPGETPEERRLQEQLDAILDSPTLRSAINGVYVVDATTGKVLYEYGADRQLNPASNTKLISTATALDLLGGDYTYVTRVVGPAPDADGVVHGDVIVQGSGDPTLRVDHLRDLAASMRSRGVKHVTGDVVTGSDERDAVAHPWVRVNVRGGAADGQLPAVRLAPDSGFFIVDNRATTGPIARGKKGAKQRLAVATAVVQTDEGPKLKVTLTGRVPARQEAEVFRGVPRPVLYTAYTLRGALLDEGIHVDGRVRQETERPEPAIDAAELGRHDSVPLRDLTAMINKPSNNFLADRLLMTVGAEKYGGDSSMQKGVEAMKEWLEQIGVTGSFRLENGSGLSHTIHVSARQIAQVLLAGAKDDRFGREWLDSLSIGGEDGTLRGRFASRPSRGFVRGKTGTLNGVAALSGFVTLRDDASVCFAILTTGFRDRRKQGVRDGQADITDAIYEYLKSRLGAEAPAAPPPEIDL